jgi:3-hydroxyisobutyrate dehydrogenase
MADSVLLQRIFTQMQARDFDPPRSYARQLNKDLHAVERVAAALGLHLPVLEAAIRQYDRYTSAGNEMQDGASVSRLYERPAGSSAGKAG